MNLNDMTTSCGAVSIISYKLKRKTVLCVIASNTWKT
jgi:hypothetical protein